MSTWVYKCNECDKTFTVDFEKDDAVTETATCPYCGSENAEKVFEIPEMSGGCGCGGSSC